MGLDALVGRVALWLIEYIGIHMGKCFFKMGLYASLIRNVNGFFDNQRAPPMPPIPGAEHRQMIDRVEEPSESFRRVHGPAGLTTAHPVLFKETGSMQCVLYRRTQ